MGRFCSRVCIIFRPFCRVSIVYVSNSLHQGTFQQPRNGKNDDHAHPPIHPTAYAGNLAGDDKRVYEYIARRFLACCSKNALGYQTRVEVEYGGEEFHATGELKKNRQLMFNPCVINQALSSLNATISMFIHMINGTTTNCQNLQRAKSICRRRSSCVTAKRRNRISLRKQTW